MIGKFVILVIVTLEIYKISHIINQVKNLDLVGSLISEKLLVIDSLRSRGSSISIFFIFTVFSSYIWLEFGLTIKIIRIIGASSEKMKYPIIYHMLNELRNIKGIFKHWIAKLATDLWSGALLAEGGIEVVWVI